MLAPRPLKTYRRANQAPTEKAPGPPFTPHEAAAAWCKQSTIIRCDYARSRSCDLHALNLEFDFRPRRS